MRMMLYNKPIYDGWLMYIIINIDALYNIETLWCVYYIYCDAMMRTTLYDTFVRFLPGNRQ